MPAQVERMFSVREMPWHREGTILQDYPGSWEEARVLAGLDWDPVTAPVYALAGISADPGEDVTGLSERYEKIGGWNAVTRSDTGAVLSIRPASYAVIDHRDMGEIIEAVLDQPNVKWETAGSLAGGKAVWCLALLDEPVELPGDGSMTYPYLAITNRHDGTASCALRATAVRIVCHAEGTIIDDHGWRGEVQNHASATQPRVCAGKQVVVWGLPFCEKVTPEHRYWARSSKKDSHGKRTGSTAAGWVEAKDLQPGHHEIGLPIDMTEEAAPAIPALSYTWRNWETVTERDPRLDNPDWWWLIGYWWGNGNIQYGRRHRVAGITVTVNEHDAASAQRVERMFRGAGGTGNATARPGCQSYTLNDATLGEFLGSWRDSYTGQKTPPAWVERLPLDLQRQLVRGYWDADGDHKTRDGAIIASIGLDGLLALRRILMRLGIPSSIRKGAVTAGTMQIQGRHVQVQQSWTIRFWRGIEQLGLTHRFRGQYSLPYIEDGHLWSRVKDITDTPEEKFWPITTATADYTTAFGRSHNCANTFRAAELEGERTGATFSFTHRAGWRDRIAEAREAVTGARREMAAYAELATGLLGTRITGAQAELFVTQFIPAPPETMITDRVAANIEHARQAVRGILASPTAAGTEGTAYWLVQAAGEYLDHVRTARSWESRLNRTLLRPESMKARALTLVRDVIAAG